MHCTSNKYAINGKKTSGKKRLSASDSNVVNTTLDGISSSVSLVNKTDDNTFNNIQETYAHLDKKTRTSIAQLEEKDDPTSESDESSESDSEEDRHRNSEEASDSSDDGSNKE